MSDKKFCISCQHYSLVGVTKQEDAWCCRKAHSDHDPVSGKPIMLGRVLCRIERTEAVTSDEPVRCGPKGDFWRRKGDVDADQA